MELISLFLIISIMAEYSWQTHNGTLILLLLLLLMECHLLLIFYPINFQHNPKTTPIIAQNHPLPTHSSPTKLIPSQSVPKHPIKVAPMTHPINDELNLENLPPYRDSFLCTMCQKTWFNLGISKYTVVYIVRISVLHMILIVFQRKTLIVTGQWWLVNE